jgi:hypothetical protein
MTAADKRAASNHKPAPYIGKVTFESTGELSSGTNEHHVDLCLAELPWLRAAIVVLNKSDVELEANMRAVDEGGRDALMDLVDTLRDIEKRHAAVIEVCQGASARLLVVFDRCINGPRLVDWAK